MTNDSRSAADGPLVLGPERLGELTTTDIGQIGRIDGAASRSFVAARALALAGMEILCIYDAPEDLALLRARAVENRTFVLATGARFAAAVAPTGAVLARTGGEDVATLRVEINPADAALKVVAPATDIWEQRRVNAYAH